MRLTQSVQSFRIRNLSTAPEALCHPRNLYRPKLTRNRFNTATCHGQLPGMAGRPPIIRVKYDNLEVLTALATPHFHTFECFSGAKLSTVFGLSSNSSNTKSRKSVKPTTRFLIGIEYPLQHEIITIAVVLVATSNLPINPPLAVTTLDVAVGALPYHVAPADARRSAPSDRNGWTHIRLHQLILVILRYTCAVAWYTFSCTGTIYSIFRNVLCSAP